MLVAYKIFNMKYISLLILIIYVNLCFSQVVPLGAIVKKNKLATVIIDPNYSSAYGAGNWPIYTFNAVIVKNGSKSPIVEKGFVAKPCTTDLWGTNPTIYDYTIKKIDGVNNLSIISTLNQFSQEANGNYIDIYSVRAYAKNSFGQVSYSDEVILWVGKNYCVGEFSYDWNGVTLYFGTNCKNGGKCNNDGNGYFCSCTIDFCGDCCAQLADSNCPGGGEQLCSLPVAYSNKMLKYRYYNNVLQSKSNTNSWAFKELPNTIKKS